MNQKSTSLILLTGATGYIGGRLLHVLEHAGQRVRCVTRRPEALQSCVASTTKVVSGNVLDQESLTGTMDGVEIAYYMVHSMGSTGDFEEQDRRAAYNFGAEARRAGVGRIIYLGGLGETSEELSPHLRSRQEVAEVLRASGVPVIEFRASIVLGSGSLSFEMIRSLVERLPVMVTPRWVNVIAQPIAIDDLLQYLSAALDVQTDDHAIFEIGGPDAVSYGDLMREYARQRRLRRLMIPVPLLTPRLSSLWLGLVTPLYARIGRKLIDSIRHPTVVRNDAARQTFPRIRPQGVREAITSALGNESSGDGQRESAKECGVGSRADRPRASDVKEHSLVKTKINQTYLALVRGDITKERVDAIANAANEGLMGGGGVDGAIHRAGGSTIMAECNTIRAKQGGCPTGQAVMTTGGNLPAQYVIHTVGPIWRGGTAGEAELLASCYRESLGLAAEHGVETIAFPSISTGVYGYPVAQAAVIALNAVKQFLAAHDGLDEVRFVLFDDATYGAYEKALGDRRELLTAIRRQPELALGASPADVLRAERDARDDTHTDDGELNEREQ